MPNYNREKKWINKKLRQGVSREELLNTVGMFSNKRKEKEWLKKS